MASVTLRPGTVTTLDLASYGYPGAADWVSPNNVKVQDASSPLDGAHVASCSSVSGSYSYGLECTNFGFGSSIHAGDRIDGIQVSLLRGCGDPGYPVQLILAFGSLCLAGVPVGNNLQIGDSNNWTTSLVWQYVGDASNLWGWGAATGTNVADSTFGVILAVLNGAAVAELAAIDVVEMTVTFTPLSGSNPPILHGGQMGRFGIHTGGRVYHHANSQFQAGTPGPRERIRRSCRMLDSRGSTSARRGISSSFARA